MVMPLLSVTCVGLVIGTFFAIVSRPFSVEALVRGLGGAWIGFVGGALAGVLMDIVMGTGATLAILGHAGAGAGAVAVASRRSRLA